MYSYICIVTPHLGTLAEAREGPKVELNPKTELVDKRIGQVLDWRMLAKRVSSDKL
jgi:hypothetical protein